MYKEESAYDSNGNETLSAGYDWDIAISQWIGKREEEWTYNDKGSMTLDIWSDWDTTISQWVSNGKTSYYYSEHNFIPESPEKHINICPNPASVCITFEVTDISESARVEIFNNQGKKVLEQKLPVNGQISISRLGKGLYLYRINNNGNIYKGKIIIE